MFFLVVKRVYNEMTNSIYFTIAHPRRLLDLKNNSIFQQKINIIFKDGSG